MRKKIRKLANSLTAAPLVGLESKGCQDLHSTDVVEVGPNLRMSHCLQVKLYVYFLVFVIICASTCLADNTKISDQTLKSSKCSYLNTDESQNNAFVFDRRECCMCPKGTHYNGICNALHPSTTVCKACEDGTYIEFDANLETKCLTKKQMHCLSPMVYEAGNTTEKPKCICPPGLEKNGRRCVNKPAVTETTSFTTRSPKFTVPTTTQRAKKISKSPLTVTSKVTKPTLIQRIISLSSTVQSSTRSEPPNDINSKTDQETTHSNDNDGGDGKMDGEAGKGMGVGYVILIIIIVVGLILLTTFIVWKCGCRDSPDSNGKMDDSSNGTPDGSRLTLIHRRRSSTPPTPRMVGPTPSMIERQQGSENPEPENSAGPIRYPPQNPSVQVSQDVPQDQYVNPVAEVRQQVPVVERNIKFAKEVAKKFGLILSSKDFLSVFRSIMGDDVNDVEINNLQERHKNDSREFIYQLMLLAIIVKGSRLTSEYLLEKVEDATPRLQGLIDIMEKELNMPYMN